MTAYAFTRYSIEGSYDAVLDAIETKLETVDNTKTIHMNKIMQRKGGDFLGVLLYIT